MDTADIITNDRKSESGKRILAFVTTAASIACSTLVIAALALNRCAYEVGRERLNCSLDTLQLIAYFVPFLAAASFIGGCSALSAGPLRMRLLLGWSPKIVAGFCV